MPIYEYRCDHCGHEFSRQQRFDEEPVGKCPNCGKRPRKLFSRPAIVFKGSGWHVTDYRKPSDKSDSGGTSSSETKSDKSDTKKDTTKKDATEKKDTTNKKAS